MKISNMEKAFIYVVPETKQDLIHQPVFQVHRDLCPKNVPGVFSVPLLFAQRARVKIRTEKESKLRPPTRSPALALLTLCHDVHVSNERGTARDMSKD